MRRLPSVMLALALGAGGAIVVAAPAAASGTASDWPGFAGLVSGQCTGNVVTLDTDITAPTGEYIDVGTGVASGCDLTLDLAGHTLDISDDVTSGRAAIRVWASNTLTIRDSVGGGTLSAVGGFGGAGIGGGQSDTPGTIVIESGTVAVTGGLGAAGIGGGQSGNGGDITISGGDVTATGQGGAGIGGGEYGSGGTITISGGTVLATSGIVSASGIGSGPYTAGGANTLDGGTISISGGDVTAAGGQDAAGIGGGEYVVGGTVTISGGTVRATGGSAAPGIGSGAGAGISGVAGTLTIIGTATPGSADQAGPTSIVGTIGLAADLDYAGGPWVTAESTIAPGGQLRVEFVPSVLTTITVHGPATADAGDTVTFTAEGFDQFGGSMGDVTGAATWTSDVAEDAVSGNEVTFTHASPHTVTATIGTVSGSLVVEVSEALAATGADPAPMLALGAALLAAGLLVVAVRKRHA